MVVEFEFGYHDEVGFRGDKSPLASKAQLLEEMKEELRFEGVLEFMRLCQHNPKFKVRSLGFTKFVK
jgi:hypothetical protein